MPLPSKLWYPNLILLWAIPELSSFGWWCFFLVRRFELVSILLASFLKLFTLRLLPSSSCPVPDLLCQTLTQMPVTIASQVGPYRCHHCWWPLLVQPVNDGFLILRGSHTNLEEVVDLSSLKFLGRFLAGFPSGFSRYLHTLGWVMWIRLGGKFFAYSQWFPSLSYVRRKSYAVKL